MSDWSNEYLDYLASATGGSWALNANGIPTLTTPDGRAYLHPTDKDPYGANVLSLNGIETEPKGNGLGTSIMNHSRAFADTTGRPFQVGMIGNRSYFNTERFPWMQEHGLGRDLRYTPGRTGRVADDFQELIRREATAPDPRPLYYLWVYDPDKDELHIDHNEDKHPAWKHTYSTLAPHVHHPEKVRGRALAIKGGWRIMDEDNHDVDPYISRRVHEELKKKHPPPKLPLVS